MGVQCSDEFAKGEWLQLTSECDVTNSRTVWVSGPVDKSICRWGCTVTQQFLSIVGDNVII